MLLTLLFSTRELRKINHCRLDAIHLFTFPPFDPFQSPLHLMQITVPFSCFSERVGGMYVKEL